MQNDTLPFAPGTRVLHPRFGIAEVVRTETELGPSGAELLELRVDAGTHVFTPFAWTAEVSLDVPPAGFTPYYDGMDGTLASYEKKIEGDGFTIFQDVDLDGGRHLSLDLDDDRISPEQAVGLAQVIAGLVWR